MKYFLPIPFLFTAFVCYSQSATTFRVKKPVTTERKISVPLYNYNLYPGIDTLNVNQLYFVNITPILGQYDSVSAVNMQLKIQGKLAILITPKYPGIGMIKFLKKVNEGNYSLLYVRQFTVAGGTPYTYLRDIKMPVLTDENGKLYP